VQLLDFTAVGKVFVVTEVSYGLGQHRRDLSIDSYRNFLKHKFFIALALCQDLDMFVPPTTVTVQRIATYCMA